MVLLASEWPDLVLEVIFSYLDLASLRYENIWQIQSFPFKIETKQMIEDQL